MANDVKRMNQVAVPSVDTRVDPSTATARLTLLACVVALAVLLTQLPGPAEALNVLTGAAVPAAPGVPLAAVQSILLITAGLLAWLLAGWAAVVLGVGLIARLPGRSGSRARRLLPQIAPASVGRLVLAAVGVSLIAGTAACAAPATADPAAAGWTTVSAPSAPSTPSPTGSLTIDWPDPGPAPITTASGSSAPGASAAAPGTTAPATPASGGPRSTAPGPVAPTPAPTPAPPVASTPVVPSTPAAVSPPVTPSAEPEAPASAANSTAEAPETPPPDPALPEPAASAPPSGTAAVAGSAAAPTIAPTPSSAAVTVQPGDSLWRIAAHSLGAGATDADVDNAWRAWYFVNREVIGDDPDVILPGQDLTAPGEAGQVRP